MTSFDPNYLSKDSHIPRSRGSGLHCMNLEGTQFNPSRDEHPLQIRRPRWASRQREGGGGQMCSPYTVGREPGTMPFSVWNSGPSGRSPPYFRVGPWVPFPLLPSPASAPTSRKRGIGGGGCRPQNPTPCAKAWTSVGTADREGVAAV